MSNHLAGMQKGLKTSLEMQLALIWQTPTLQDLYFHNIQLGIVLNIWEHVLEACKEPQQMLNEDELQDNPLVFANKQDLSNAMNAAEIISQAQTVNIVYSGEY